MEDVSATPKKSTTLSVDRAAFLLLRVKKAFKKKRQQRKEKQIQLAGTLTNQSQSRPSRKFPPPPLLRSRTLPAIILPGIPVVSLCTDRNVFQLEEPSANLGHRWSLLPRNASITPESVPSTSGSGQHSNNNNNSSKLKSLNILKDDTSLVYRRKSSGSTPHSGAGGNKSSAHLQNQQQHCQQQHQQTPDSGFLHAADDFESHASDGSLMLRIPTPHVVAARAYRLAAKSRSHAPTVPDFRYTSDTAPFAHGVGYDGSNSTGSSNEVGSSSGSTANTALTRLAKLLHQSSVSTSKAPQVALENYVLPIPRTGGPEGMDDAPRRLSWERRKDSSALQRSASIDSFAKLVWSDSPRPSLVAAPVVPFSKRPSASSLFSNSSTSSQSAQLNINYVDIATGGNNRRDSSLLSPSATRRNKLTRIINDNFIPNNGSNVKASCHDESGEEFIKLSRFSYNDNSRNKSNNNNNNNSNNNSKNNNNNNNKNNNIGNHMMNDVASYSNNLNTLRWSKRFAQNVVSVAKIRTGISTPTSKEMEFLIPHPPTTTSTTSATTTALDNGEVDVQEVKRISLRDNGQQDAECTSITPLLPRALHSKMKMPSDAVSSSSSSTSSSTICNSVTASASVSTRNANSHVDSTINSKATKSKTESRKDGGGGNGGSNNHNLVIYRPTSMSARSKNGNTPHRNKLSKKQLKLAQAQLDKLTQINLHLHALFAAVEHGHLDKARTIVESTDVDVNSMNSDGLSVLDVAVLSNNRSMTKMLLQHGAVDSSQYAADGIDLKLNGLLKDAESRINELSGTELIPQTHSFASRPSISSIIIGNSGSAVTGCTGNEIDKQIGIWERRVKGLRRLLLGWDQTRPPDEPAAVTVEVTAENAFAIQIMEPLDGAISTKFKVQWSTRADFSNVVGEREITDWSSFFHGAMGTKCTISGLTQGRQYYIRAACGNIKAWGQYKTSIPACITPSSWRDFSNREDRYAGRQYILDNLFTAVRLARPADVSELTLDSNTSYRRNPKKKTTIKQLFSVASKFHKNLKRGIYLVSIIYCEDKVLVTSEDFLPVIEIDESYPNTLHSDYHWLMKISCNWDDVKSLRSDMGRNLTPNVHFRTKLLSAVCQMQSALGMNDLGQLYYKPLRDGHGTVALSCIQVVRSQKSVSIINSRWLPVNKLQKKVVALLEDYNINDILISSIAEQIHYHQTSLRPLDRGLYLGYLKMQCSVDQIQVVVPIKTPNILPHSKVRENSHITAEEWQILTTHGNNNASGARIPSLQLANNGNPDETTEVQKLFLHDLTMAAHNLFTTFKIKPEDALAHRLYDIEVIELSRDISFIIICPPSVELSCTVPGKSELLLQHQDLASLSIQAFELIHLRTYQSRITQKYSRLSCILELDTALANYSQREAFSTEEMQTAKERLAKLHELTANLNAVWKGVRWLMDVIAFARDKNVLPSAAIKDILEYYLSHANEDASIAKSQLLQPPARDDVKLTKTGSGRGSWPGPATSSAERSVKEACLAAEQHSKSEQNLGSSRAIKHHSTSGLMAQTQMGKSAKGIQKLFLQVGSSTSEVPDHSLRKHSDGSVASSQYSGVTASSMYSGIESTSTNKIDYLDSYIFTIPSSRSDDTLTAGSVKPTSTKSVASQRKRTTSSIALSHVPTPVITVQSSCSSMAKVKAASSGNLRDTDKPHLVSMKNYTESLTRPSSEEDNASCSSLSLERVAVGSSGSSGHLPSSSIDSTGIIQVYTAYNTGLASGTSLKLHVTPKTTAREVINLVVEQLNMASTMLKGDKKGPIYTPDMLDNFCLVAVIGARERCLRDDFKPLQLQNPWKKGRLYVRQKHELLAAIEHSNRKSSHLI